MIWPPDEKAGELGGETRARRREGKFLAEGCDCHMSSRGANGGLQAKKKDHRMAK